MIGRLNPVAIGRLFAACVRSTAPSVLITMITIMSVSCHYMTISIRGRECLSGRLEYQQNGYVNLHTHSHSLTHTNTHTHSNTEKSPTSYAAPTTLFVCLSHTIRADYRLFMHISTRTQRHAHVHTHAHTDTYAAHSAGDSRPPS